MKKLNFIGLLSALFIITSAFNTAVAEKDDPNYKITKCDTELCKHWYNEYKRKSREGYSDAMETLGSFYHVGYGTEVDRALALKWYKRSAKYFSVAGSYKTGLFYLTESGFIDTDKGISYLKKAARKGHSESSYLVGMLYSQQEYVQPDYDEADKWLSQAYRTAHEKVKAYTHYLNDEDMLTIEKFPELSLLYQEQQALNEAQLLAEQKALNNQKEQFNSPQDEMEVIEISPLMLTDLFAADFDFFKTFMAEKRSGQAQQGLYRRPCAETLSCAEMSKSYFNYLRSIDGGGALAGN
ncbi:tetratricopeptide repeat protein [Colwelliaceae bacterium BS250]